nr:MAG TPA: hypothetical protein [Caudoviricetes sp.]
MSDKFSNLTLSFMGKRLGMHYPGPPVYAPDGSVLTSLEGIYQQGKRLKAGGGYAQQERMINDKKKTLDRVLYYSYQGADIQKIAAGSVSPDAQTSRALINPNKVKQDYDDKIVSCHWEFNLAPGTVIKWLGTNTYWLIYLQDLTELAYFKGNIRKCNHSIKWMDEKTKNIHSTYAAIIGPSESKISSANKVVSNLDSPNYSLKILIPETKESLEYFRRYAKFYIQGFAEGSPLVCWRVTAVDWISTPGIIELIAEEYYINKDTDDIGELPEQKEIAARLAKEENLKRLEESKKVTINGETFIKPKKTYTYTCAVGGQWKAVGKDLPIKLISKSETKLEIMWDKFYSGQFILKCGDIEKTIVVETL